MSAVETLEDAALAYAYSEGWTPPEGEVPPIVGGGAGGTFTIRDNGGVAQEVTGINWRGKLDAVTVESGIATIDARPADVPILRAEAFSVYSTVGGSTTALTVPSLLYDMKAGDAFDVFLKGYVKSSTFSKAKVALLGPRGAAPSDMMGDVFQPAEFNADGTDLIQGGDGGLEVRSFRNTVFDIPTMGAQRIGGFPTTKSATDFKTTSGSKTITSASFGFIADKHEGACITGAGMPPDVIIESVQSATSATLSIAATATSAASNLQVQQLGWVPFSIEASVRLGESGTPGTLELRLGQITASAARTQLKPWHTKMLLSRV